MRVFYGPPAKPFDDLLVYASAAARRVWLAPDQARVSEEWPRAWRPIEPGEPPRRAGVGRRRPSRPPSRAPHGPARHLRVPLALRTPFAARRRSSAASRPAAAGAAMRRGAGAHGLK